MTMLKRTKISRESTLMNGMQEVGQGLVDVDSLLKAYDEDCDLFSSAGMMGEESAPGFYSALISFKELIEKVEMSIERAKSFVEPIPDPLEEKEGGIE